MSECRVEWILSNLPVAMKFLPEGVNFHLDVPGHILKEVPENV